MKQHFIFPSTGPISFLPILHYNMEFAALTHEVIHQGNFDCIAVEAPLGMQPFFKKACARLPDISVLSHESSYYLIEPCEATFEAIRSGLEKDLPIYCIDLPQIHYPSLYDPIPDPYASKVLGFKSYLELLLKENYPEKDQDRERETFIASHLSELRKHYSNILYVGGVAHIKRLQMLLETQKLSKPSRVSPYPVEHFTISEKCYREIQGELGFTSLTYEEARKEKRFPLDRKSLYYNLFKATKKEYEKATGFQVRGYHTRQLFRFYRKYASLTNRLLPTNFQLLSGARACVDHNFAYELWLQATNYPLLKNIDRLEERELSCEELWGGRKKISFELKQKSNRAYRFQKRERDQSNFIKTPLNPYNICSYQPEDIIIESFAKHLKKRGKEILKEDSCRTVPFQHSLEQGIDMKETLRHHHEGKIYVRTQGKPPQATGSVVLIFDEDLSPKKEKFPWCTTWLGEHNQESDMAFYASEMNANIIGPGIARCQYGGLMMSYPPSRLHPIWEDESYGIARNKPERLLLAAIDYSIEPVILYIAKKPPRAFFKSLAGKFGKKILYLPMGQISPIMLHKIQAFHVLSGHHTRAIADDYIY